MKWKILTYRPDLKELAKKLRNNSTLSEKILWKYLKGKQINGYDFDRQKPIDNFIIDFFCKEIMLAIEIDGTSHKEKIIEDRYREDKLSRLGIKFLRFTDSDVMNNPEGVSDFIRQWINDNIVNNDNPPPAPPKEGR